MSSTAMRRKFEYASFQSITINSNVAINEEVSK